MNYKNDLEYIKELEMIIVDLLDGSCYWYEIQANTGLSDERCKEIEALYCDVIWPQYKNKHNL